MKKSYLLLVISSILIGMVMFVSRINYSVATDGTLTDGGLVIQNGGKNTFIFETNGGSKINNLTVCVSCGETIVLPTPTKSEYTFMGWYTDISLTTPYSSLTILGGKTCTLYARWMSTSQLSNYGYTLNFYSYGGSNCSSIFISYGNVNNIVLPTPNKSAYDFKGWYLDKYFTTMYNPKTYLDFINSGATSITVYAKWEKGVSNNGGSYTLKFNTNGGSAVSDLTICPGCGDKVTLPVTTKVGYVFNGWYIDEQLTTIYSSINLKAETTKTYTLYAKWTKSTETLKGYTLYFHPNGGTVEINSMYICGTCSYVGSYILPTPVYKWEGFVFEGWYIDTAFTRLYSPTTYTDYLTNGSIRLTVYAKWKKEITQVGGSYTLKFNTNGGNTLSNISVCIGCEPTDLPTPTKSGYVFGGWFIDEALTKPYSTLVAQSGKMYTVYAKWIEDIPVNGGSYTLKFNTNGGTAVESKSICVGCSPSMQVTLPTPQRTGYSFVGWYTDEALTTEYNYSSFVGEANKTYTLYAKWTQSKVYNPVGGTYSLVFNTNGGTSVNTISVCIACGPSYVPNLPIPQKTGYTFDNWYTDEGLTIVYNYLEFNGLVGKKYTLYAKWVEEIKADGGSYTLNFETNGGVVLSPITVCVACGDTYKVSLPTPIKTGYTFVGWYTDKELSTSYSYISFVASSGEKYTLYAKWVETTTNTFYSNSSIYLKADENTLDSMYSLETQEVTLEEEEQTKLENLITNMNAYNINITLNSTINVQPNGMVKLYFPVENGLKEDNIGIYSIDEYGNVITYKVYYENGEVYTYTDHFSVYIVGNLTTSEIIKQNKFIIIGTIFVVIIAIFGTVLIRKNKRTI